MIDISICCVISIICYFVIGIFICKQYIDIVNDRKRKKGGIKKNVNRTKRLLKRLSIILFYPLYAIILLIGLIIELLTEDEPFE